MDPGRQADLKLIDDKLSDFTLSKHKREMLNKARAAIAVEQSNPQVKHLRDLYIRATQAGNQAEIEKYGKQLDILSKGGKL